MSDLHYLSACEQRQQLLDKEISSEELVQAHLKRIEAVNPKLNAIVTLSAETALAKAKEADRALAQGKVMGVLHGLPTAHKDLTYTAGVRTTRGSPLFANFIPESDDLIVARQKAAGAISLGKTNTPEFGAGSQTFNPVFGTTKNPYDLSRTCGGSSGGAAVALASGMVPLADGSDMGGSLRNPAAFCNVVGFRPTPGLVPSWPSSRGWANLGVKGPMARSVQDVALFLAAIAGYEARSPISRHTDNSVFLKPLEADMRQRRIAWCLDFAGLPFETEIVQTLEPLEEVFRNLGCVTQALELDFGEADEVFKVLRAHAFAADYHQLIKDHPEAIKDTVIWNTEEGLKLSALDLAKAEQQRTQLFARIASLMQEVDFIILPVTQVLPFDHTIPYIQSINGEAMHSYIDWMKSCYYISVLGNPAISVPGGFSPEGLPVGLQIVGRYGADLEVLQLAHAFEQATGFGRQRPALV